MFVCYGFRGCRGVFVCLIGSYCGLFVLEVCEWGVCLFCVCSVVCACRFVSRVCFVCVSVSVFEACDRGLCLSCVCCVMCACRLMFFVCVSDCVLVVFEVCD